MASTVEFEVEGGEGYFASASDLMVGVLFVFLLMLTVFALNFRDAEEKQMVERQRYEELRRELMVAREEARRQEEIALRETQNARRQQAIAIREAASARRKEAENVALRELLTKAVAQLERDLENRQLLRHEMLRTLEDSLRERGVRVRIDTRTGVLRLSGDLLFETGKAAYREEARRTVELLAEVMGEVLPCYAGRTEGSSCALPEPILETVLVEGHTDRQPYRAVSIAISQERNDALSTRRALAVFQTLRHTQPVLDTLLNGDGQPLLGVSGYGERRPLVEAQGDTLQEFELNRRIDVRFVLTSRTSDEIERLRDQIRQVLAASP